jgi:hypothetical protein
MAATKRGKNDPKRALRTGRTFGGHIDTFTDSFLTQMIRLPARLGTKIGRKEGAVSLMRFADITEKEGATQQYGPL